MQQQETTAACAKLVDGEEAGAAVDGEGVKRSQSIAASSDWLAWGQRGRDAIGRRRRVSFSTASSFLLFSASSPSRYYHSLTPHRCCCRCSSSSSPSRGFRLGFLFRFLRFDFRLNILLSPFNSSSNRCHSGADHDVDGTCVLHSAPVPPSFLVRGLNEHFEFEIQDFGSLNPPRSSAVVILLFPLPLPPCSARQASFLS
jgi:hypothetical protein